MRLFSVYISTVFVVLSGSSCLAANAITYIGMLGKSSIIMELESPLDDATFAGRYSYMEKGVDIPLHGVASGKQVIFTLSEEKPCTEDLCLGEDGNPVQTIPFGAIWTLNESRDGTTLQGTWQEKGGAEKLPVALQRSGARDIDYPGHGLDALDPSFPIHSQTSPAFVDEEDLPYDFAKMNHPLVEGKVHKNGEYSYRMDTDPRTGLDYPVVLRIDVENPDPINSWLAQQRLQLSLWVFHCRSKAYLGYGWTKNLNGKSDGFDGNIAVSVDYFTERLIGVGETGSYFCGGAYPENFSHDLYADVKTGEPIKPERLLKGWVAKDANWAIVDPAKASNPDDLRYGPSDKLIDFVIKHRQKFDAQTESDCGYDDLVRSHLGVNFVEDSLVFTLKNLPHAIFACTDVMATVPIKDARDLLTKKGATYFVQLDK